MNNTTKPLLKNRVALLFVVPFLVSIILLIVYLGLISKFSLSPPFNVNITAILIISIIHFSSVMFFIKRSKISFSLSSKFKQFRSIIPVVLIFLFSIVSSLLLVMSLKMNLNYWLRNDSIENIKIYVTNKYISKGRGTDYYIEFDFENSKLKYMVGKGNYEKFKIGDSFDVEVQKGYFEGYFLIKKLN
jgi:hypothetical protein